MRYKASVRSICSTARLLFYGFTVTTGSGGVDVLTRQGVNEGDPPGARGGVGVPSVGKNGVVVRVGVRVGVSVRGVP